MTSRSRAQPRLIAALAPLALACTLACPRAPAATVVDAGPAVPFDPQEALLVDLEKDELAWRASTDWATFPSSDATLGPDPYDIVDLGNGLYAGALRGENAVVLLNAQGMELDRAPAPKGVRSLAVDAHDDLPGIAVDVVGDLDPAVFRVNVGGAGQAGGTGPMIFTSGGRLEYVPHASGLRGVARSHVNGKSTLHVVDVNGHLRSLPRGKSARDFTDEPIGPFALAPRVATNERARSTWIATPSVQGHRVVVTQLEGGKGAATFGVDGPVLGLALHVEDSGDALVAFGLIEDHPLDRTIGSFGFIDSFVRVVRVSPTTGEATKLVDVNLSEHGVITPKALAFVDGDTLLVAGAGSAKAASVSVTTGMVGTLASLPGVVALVPLPEGGFIGASPLLDAWVIVESTGARATAVKIAASAPERSVDSRLGEALVFTSIMAPRQKSDGALSRFTCEACHFEGIVDGRTHDTGRMGAMSSMSSMSSSPPVDPTPDGGVGVEEHVRATTKPLWGLFNNVPLFTRAMDPNITRMVHAEFNVANSNSPLDPWFALTPADASWLSLLGVQGTRSPIELRKAMVAFFRDFTPRTNPHVAARLAKLSGTAQFTDEERRGAEVFRARCVSCHAARLVGDDPKSEQPFEKWEALVFSTNAPIVWSSPEHRKTGIEPYVHEDGARASSLRRVWLKTPLFTTGVARTLDDVLHAARTDGATFLHASKRGAPLADDEMRALLAFLRLL